MKALVLDKTHSVRCLEIPRPVLAHGEVLVRIRACGPDYAARKERRQGRMDLIPGSGGAGEVAEVFDKEDQDLLGKRVAVFSWAPCMGCEACKKGNYHFCTAKSRLGEVREGLQDAYVPGTMAEYCKVRRTQVFPIGEELSYEAAATADALAGALGAVLAAGKLFAQDAVILGDGEAGPYLVPVLQANGIRKILVAGDAGTYEGLGANEIVPMGQDTEEMIKRLTEGQGAGIIFDTAGTKESQRLALDLCGKKGTIVNLTSGEEELFYLLKDFSGERSMVHFAGPVSSQFYDCLRMLEAKKLCVEPLIAHMLSFEEAVRRLEEGRR